MMSVDMFIECSTIVLLSILKHALQRPCGHFPVCIFGRHACSERHDFEVQGICGNLDVWCFSFAHVLLNPYLKQEDFCL